jgi:hypothetical protein
MDNVKKKIMLADGASKSKENILNMFLYSYKKKLIEFATNQLKA